MRNSDNFRFHVVTEYSFAIFVSKIFHLRVCVCVRACMCLTILPPGHPECADSKRIAHQYSCEFMLSLMLQQIVSDQTHSLYLCPHECISQTERQSVCERGRVIRGGEKWREQREGWDCYRWSYVSSRWKGDSEKRREKIIQMRGEGEGEKKGRSREEKREERLSRKEKRRELSSKGICPTLVWLMNPKCPESVLNHRRPS